MSNDFYFVLPRFYTDNDDKEVDFLFGKSPTSNYILFDSNDYTINMRRLKFIAFNLIEKSKYIDDLMGIYQCERNPYYIVITFKNEVSAQIDVATKIMSRFMAAFYLVLPKIELGNPIDYIHYHHNYPNIIRYTSLFGREVYEKKLTEYVSLDDIGMKVCFIYLVLANYDSKFPEIIKMAIKSFVDTYSIDDRHTKAIILISIIELLFDSMNCEISNVDFSENVVNEFFNEYSVHRNRIAHEYFTVPEESYLALNTCCQILIFEYISSFIENGGELIPVKQVSLNLIDNSKIGNTLLLRIEKLFEKRG